MKPHQRHQSAQLKNMRDGCISNGPTIWVGILIQTKHEKAHNGKLYVG